MPTDPERQELDELRSRLERLEQRLDAPAAGAEREDEDPFWVVEGVRRRHGDGITYAGIAELPGRAPAHWQITREIGDLVEQDWSELAGVLSAVAHPVRLRLLQLVARGEAATAPELTRVADLGTSGQIYHHLRQLVAAGWLRSGVRGRHEIPPERVVPLLVVLSAAARS